MPMPFNVENILYTATVAFIFLLGILIAFVWPTR